VSYLFPIAILVFVISPLLVPLTISGVGALVDWRRATSARGLVRGRRAHAGNAI
jgi:hypothetical protein